jgi:hypothetical protein
LNPRMVLPTATNDPAAAIANGDLSAVKPHDQACHFFSNWKYRSTDLRNLSMFQLLAGALLLLELIKNCIHDSGG